MGLPSAVLGETTSFHVGNSLTADSQLFALPEFAEMRGKEHVLGFHLRGSSSLTKIWDTPFDEAVAVDQVYGNFTSALSDYEWDVVTLQSHRGHLLEEEIASALEFIDLTQSNPANDDTVFYIYEAWPDRIFGTYQQQWLAPPQNLTNPPMTRSRAYFDRFYDRLITETDATIRTIPVGEVLYQFDLAAEAGEIPGFSSVNQLYRDLVHLNVEVGRYIASATTFATIFNENPLVLSKPDNFFLGNKFALTPEFYEAIHRIIRRVLNEDMDSGVYFPYSDHNFDGKVDGTDLSLWEASYPGPQYDIDSDGRVSGSDFLMWQRNYNPHPNEFIDSPANLDGEGIIDGDDLAIWEAAYGVNDSADLDGDGDTDGRDFLALQREFTLPNIADVNRDRRVDGQDLKFWEASYGYQGLVDFDEDGETTGRDFLLWQREATRQSTPVQAVNLVPEPATSVVGVMLFVLHMTPIRVSRVLGGTRRSETF